MKFWAVLNLVAAVAASVLIYLDPHSPYIILWAGIGVFHTALRGVEQWLG